MAKGRSGLRLAARHERLVAYQLQPGEDLSLPRGLWSRTEGPLQTVKGCHEEPLRSMDDGNWVLRIPEEKMAENWRERTVLMTGAASFLVLLKCRVIHGSARNASARMRLLLLNVYSLADSLAYVTNPIPSEYERAIVAGSPARRFCHHPLGCEMPPDWSKGYVGPWQHQQQSGGAIAR